MLLLLALLTAAGPPKLGTVAVLEIKALDAMSKPQVELVQEVILGDLARTRRFEVIGASDIAAMLGLERQKQLAGCAEDANTCLAELGGALGAEFLLLGSMARIDQDRRIDLKLLDTRKNKVIGREFALSRTDSGIIEETRRCLAELLLLVPGFAPAPAALQASEPGKPLPVAPLATVIGGAALTVGGGLLAGLTVAEFNRRRGEIFFSDVPKWELQKNLGLVGGAVGLALLGTGIYLWISPASPQVSFVPSSGGGVLAVSGVWP